VKTLYRAIDICCCDGGVSEGLNRSKLFAKIVGVDIDPHPDYPFEFIQKDFQDLDPNWIRKNFDVMWISPPCPAFSWGSAKERNKGKEYMNLVPQARELIEKTGIPAVIENVVGAPIRPDLILCGVTFGLGVVRHRKFELHKFFVVQPPHVKHARPYLDAFNQFFLDSYCYLLFISASYLLLIVTWCNVLVLNLFLKFIVCQLLKYSFLTPCWPIIYNEKIFDLKYF